MFVVHPPRGIDRRLAERLVWLLQQEAPPPDIAARGTKVDALVAREADCPRRGDQNEHIGCRERSADQMVAPPNPFRKTKRRNLHRVSASKQYIRRSLVGQSMSA